jgi:hypothetical protein
LFARLGHYALWDDEAGTALNAKSILATGDMSVWVDQHNIFAYRGGAELRDLKNRYVPPLAAGVTAAAFAAARRTDAWTARAPFAAMGLATVGLLLWSVRRTRAGPAAGWLMSAAILGHVSFFLYARQARYYAAAMLLTLAIALVYASGRTTRAAAGLVAGLSVLLCAANYLNYLALYLCLAVDYVVWRRHERPLTAGAWAVLLVPQVMLCGAIAAIWNPFTTQGGAAWHPATLGDKVLLFAWQWRDLNQNEFVCGALVIAAACLAWRRRDPWLRRGLAALVVYVAAITALSPQPVAETSAADIRYLAPLIPLGMILSVRAISQLTARRVWLAAPIALAAAGTNLFHGGPLLERGLRSTIADYVQELRAPPTDPFTVAAAWISRHVRAGESILVLPDYMTYPLMFHAPAPVYAWQLPMPPAPQFAGLPAIHFMGQVAPDYIVAFGPSAAILRGWCQSGTSYVLAATLDHFWKDVHRPELHHHRFAPVTRYAPATEAIYIFTRRPLPEAVIPPR